MKRLLSPTCGLGPIAVLSLAACGSGSEDPNLMPGVEIRINELQPSNQTTWQDPDSPAAAPEFDDWVELYNPTDEDADLEGYFVGDDPAEQYREALRPGVVVPANGYVILYLDNDGAGDVADQGPNHLTFKLSAAGEYFLISGPDGALLDSVQFGTPGAQEVYARFPDGDGDFSWCGTATPGESNGNACPSP